MDMAVDEAGQQYFAARIEAARLPGWGIAQGGYFAVADEHILDRS